MTAASFLKLTKMKTDQTSAALLITEQPNLDEGTYASIMEQLMPLLRSAKGV